MDITTDLLPEQLGAIKADPKLNEVLRPPLNLGYLALNTAYKPLSDVRVRTALAMAINKKAIVDAFWNGLGVSNASFVPPVLAWANSDAVPADYKYDPAAAKKMLSDAGYANGFTVDFWYMPTCRPYFPTPKPIAEAIAADLAAVGIKVNLKTEDWGKYLDDRSKPPYFDMYMIGWTGDYGDPDNFYAAYYGGTEATKDSGWNPPEVDRLLAQGVAATSQADKAKAYAKLHELTYNAAVRVPVVHSQPLAAARSYVKGWIPSPLGSEAFNKITVIGKK